MAAPPQNHRVRVLVEIDQQIRRAVQQDLPQQFQRMGHTPAEAQAMAQRAYAPFEPRVTEMTASTQAASSRMTRRQADRRIQELTDLVSTITGAGPFALGRTGTTTFRTSANFDMGNVHLVQNALAAQSQMAETRMAAFTRAAVTGTPTYFETISPEGSISKVRASTTEELFSKIRKLREADPRFRPQYFDPGIANVEQFINQAADPSLTAAERGTALFAAQEMLTGLSGRYESERATRASGRRVLREERGESSGRVVERRLGRRVQRLENRFTALGGRVSPSMNQRLINLQAALIDYDAEVAQGRGPEARYEIETAAAELEREAEERRAPTERQADTARSRLAGARTARERLEEAMRGPVDLNAPGKRRAVALTAAQQARFAQAQADIRQAEALVAMPADQQTATDQARAALLSKQAADAIKHLTSEIKGNTKAQNDSNKMMADFTPRQALGMAMVTRALGGRVSGVLSQIASGAVPGQVVASGVAGLAGGLQDYAFNRFIQTPTKGGFAGLAITTAASVATNFLSNFAQRGYQIRNEVVARRADRHFQLGEILAGTSMFNDIYGPTSESFKRLEAMKVGDVLTTDFLKSFGIKGISTKNIFEAGLGVAALPQSDIDAAKRKLRGHPLASFARTLVSAATPGIPRASEAYEMLTNQSELEIAKSGIKLEVLKSERDKLKQLEEKARSRFSYSGLVNINEMVKAAGSISAQGVPLRRFAPSIRGGQYEEGLSELGLGAYATYISKMGLDQKSVESVIAMQGMGMLNAGLTRNASGYYKSTALDTLSYAIQSGMPSTIASQLLGTGLSMAKEGMFTDLTALAERTRGLSMSGITPGTIGLVQSNMMQTRKSALNTLTAPFKQLNQGMALVYAIQKGGDLTGAIDVLRSGAADTGSRDYTSFLSSELGLGDLAGGILQAEGARRADVSNFFKTKAAPLSADEKAVFAVQSALVGLQTESARLAAQEAKGDVTPGQEARKSYTESNLDDIATTLSRIADTLSALIY